MARDDFEDFFGDDDDTPIVDTRADGRLYRVPLGRLSPNLVNPRFDFGTEDDLIDFGKSLARRQNQACPVVSRGAYLKLWPDHEDRIGDIDYVLVSGERRYRAATAVGLPALDCVVNDDFAADRKTFMEAVVSENVDRQNFDPIEEAYAVQALVREFGSNRAVAQHFDRVDGWVTQRVLLTHLVPEVQDLVRTKAIPLEAARSLGKQARDNQWDASEQLAWWEAEQERRAASAAAKAAARKAAKQQPPVQPEAPVVQELTPAPQQRQESPSFTAVKHAPAPAPAREDAAADREAGPAEYHGVIVAEPPAATQPAATPPAPAHARPDVPADCDRAEPPSRPAADTVPEPRSAELLEGKKFPYDRPEDVHTLLTHKMDPDRYLETLALMVRTAHERDPERLDALLETARTKDAV